MSFIYFTLHFTVSHYFIIGLLDVPSLNTPLDVPGQFIPVDKINICTFLIVKVISSSQVQMVK